MNAKAERRQIVREKYESIGHADECSIYAWRAVMPDGTSDAMIYGTVGAHEKQTGCRLDKHHPPPPGGTRADRKLGRIANIMFGED